MGADSSPLSPLASAGMVPGAESLPVDLYDGPLRLTASLPNTAGYNICTGLLPVAWVSLQHGGSLAKVSAGRDSEVLLSVTMIALEVPQCLFQLCSINCKVPVLPSIKGLKG